MKQEFHEYRTSNAMEWDTMLSLVRKLYRDGDYRMSLLIGCSSFFGTRISDTLSLTWSMLLNGEKFTIYEKKTGKRRVIKINKGFQSTSRLVMMLCILLMKMKSVFYRERRWYIQLSVSISYSRKSKNGIISR